MDDTKDIDIYKDNGNIWVNEVKIIHFCMKIKKILVFQYGIEHLTLVFHIEHCVNRTLTKQKCTLLKPSQKKKKKQGGGSGPSGRITQPPYLVMSQVLLSFFCEGFTYVTISTLQVENKTGSWNMNSTISNIFLMKQVC